MYIPDIAGEAADKLTAGGEESCQVRLLTFTLLSGASQLNDSG